MLRDAAFGGPQHEGLGLACFFITGFSPSLTVRLLSAASPPDEGLVASGRYRRAGSGSSGAGLTESPRPGRFPATKKASPFSWRPAVEHYDSSAHCEAGDRAAYAKPRIGHREEPGVAMRGRCPVEDRESGDRKMPRARRRETASCFLWR